MTNRITNKWTRGHNALTKAYGRTHEAIKGELGEQLFYNWAKNYYEQVFWNEEPHQQVSGADFYFKKARWPDFFSVDVKCNFYENGVFYIENHPLGWLRNPEKTSTWICHIRPSDKNSIWYRRQRMIQLLDERPNLLLKSSCLKVSLPQITKITFEKILEPKVI